MPCISRIGLALIAVVVACPPAARAHEVKTHQQIGAVAIACSRDPSCVPTDHPTRPTLASLEGISWGEEHEDDFIRMFYFDEFRNALLSFGLGRFMFHFYDPLHPGSPLSGTFPFIVGDPLIGFQSVNLNVAATCTSVQWGTTAASCSATYSGVNSIGTLVPLASYVDTNRFSWDHDRETDAAGVPTALAVQRFGYVVHLLEDLGSPAHVRNDGHPCKLEQYCSAYEKFNDGRKPATPIGPPLISTTGFTEPADFFTAMAIYTATNYYSDRTAFGFFGPQLATEDDQYFYGNCIPASFLYGRCETINGHPFVRKIAWKGPGYRLSCIAPGNYHSSNCDRTRASIDNVIAAQQFDELGPVIAQHVAAFIHFYAPAVSVTIERKQTGNGKVTTDNQGIDCGDKCETVFGQGRTVTLKAEPDAISRFTGWKEDCASAGTNDTATLTLTSDRQCTATFEPSLTGTWLLEYDYGPECANLKGSETLVLKESAAGIISGTVLDVNVRPFFGVASGTVTGTHIGNAVNTTRTFTSGFVTGDRAFRGTFDGITINGTIPCNGTDEPVVYRRQ